MHSSLHRYLLKPIVCPPTHHSKHPLWIRTWNSTTVQSNSNNWNRSGNGSISQLSEFHFELSGLIIAACKFCLLFFLINQDSLLTESRLTKFHCITLFLSLNSHSPAATSLEKETGYKIRVMNRQMAGKRGPEKRNKPNLPSKIVLNCFEVTHCRRRGPSWPRGSTCTSYSGRCSSARAQSAGCQRSPWARR